MTIQDKLIDALELLIRTLGPTEGAIHLAVIHAQAVIAEAKEGVTA